MSGATAGGGVRVWCLEGVDGDGAEVRLFVAEDQVRARDYGVTLGRHPALAEIVVDDPSVSRRHARLSLREGALAVEDLNSLNGTRLDETALAPFARTPIREGQTLGLGRVTLVLGRAG